MLVTGTGDKVVYRLGRSKGRSRTQTSRGGPIRGRRHDRGRIFATRFLDFTQNSNFATELPCPRGGDTTKHENGTRVAEIYKATTISPNRRHMIMSRVLCKNERRITEAVCSLAVLPLLVLALTPLLPTNTFAQGNLDQPVIDGGFENQRSPTISAPWLREGQGFKGIDIAKGLASTGSNNAFIRTTAHEWNAVTQVLTVRPNTRYLVEAMVRTSGNMHDGYFGVRTVPDNTIIKERKYGPLPKYTRLVVDVPSGNRTQLLLFVGYWATGEDSWIQIDDVHVGKAVAFDDHN
jgi:hypothetical protein